MMRNPTKTSCFVLVLALCAAAPAWAQGLPSNRGFQPPVKQKSLPGDTPVVPPPALPGAKPAYEPAERTQLDLPPTEALFDAINRGDIAAARDAIGRGADMTGRNILGMSPMELSVDLARNDITFLLLSLRTGTPAPVGIATAKPPAGKPAKVAAVPMHRTPAPPPALAARPAPAPQQFAGPADPGTPNPQAGFLGFGGAVRAP